MSFELIFSALIVLNISLLIYATCRVSFQIARSRSRSELGIKNFDDTKSSRRKEQDKKTLQIVIYLIGIIGALLLSVNLTPLMFGGGIFFILFAGSLYTILKLSK